MIIGKITKQKWDLLQSTHPDLYATLNLHLKKLTIGDLPNEDKGYLAGLIIEYILKSGGSIDIFQDEVIPQSYGLDAEFIN